MGGTVSLYEVLKARKTGLSPDLYTLLRARQEMSESVITAEPPIYFKSDGTAISEYQINGDTVQSGTPTPDNPVEVLGVGDRTGNLFDKNATNVNNGYIANGYLRSDGSITTNIDYRASEYIRMAQNQSYNLYYGTYLNAPSVCFYDGAKNYISGVTYSGRWDVPFTTPQNAEYLRISFRAVDLALIILNTGSIRLPYEPYGYKIPITLNSVTRNVYLDEPLYSGDYIKRNADGTGVLHQDGADTPITLPQLSVVKGNNELNISTTVTPKITLKGKIKQLPDSDMNALLSIMEEM